MPNLNGLPKAQLQKLHAELPSLYGKLLNYAARVARRHGWAGKRGMPAGFDATDAVQEAVEQVLGGVRAWPEGVSVFSVLCGAIRSNLSNLHDHSAAAEVHLDSLPTDDEDDQRQPFQPAAPGASVEMQMVDEERERWIEAKLTEESRGDAAKIAVLRCMRQGPCTPDEIIAKSKVKAQRIYDAISELKARGRELVEEWEKRQ